MQHCYDNKFAKNAIRVLRAEGYRITVPRRLVLEALAARQEPASPYELQKALKEHGDHLDHVTIYRIVELLERLNLIHKVLSTGGYVRCTLENSSGCHRYLVCRQCGALQEFADESLCRKENEIAAKMGFQADHHIEEFHGLCADCHA